jgi:NAD+ synthase
MKRAFSSDVLKIDCEQEVDRICEKIKIIVGSQLKRRGIVIGVSGGIDSSVTLALAVRALGKERIIALQMPERHSAAETLFFSNLLVKQFEVEEIHEDITAILNAVGFYNKYVTTVKNVIPSYDENWKSKIVLPGILEGQNYLLFSLIAQSPDGQVIKTRLDAKAYLGIVSVTNFKQRIRKMLEYYHADRMNFAVAGTPNRLEYDQGFFVKLGDGAADIKPIAHLYKSQVYQIAEFLNVPEQIRKRPPTTDTYSLAQNQDEFYFQLPYDKLDICLYAKNNNIDPSAIATEIGLSEEAVRLVFADIDLKRRATRYLHLKPQLIEDVAEIEA